MWLARTRILSRRIPRAWWLYALGWIASPWALAVVLWWSFLPFKTLFGADLACVMGLR